MGVPADCLRGALVWVARRFDLHGPGLLGFGLDPGRLLAVEAGAAGEAAWAVEEALRAPGVALVVGELAAPSARLGRRLQLAAEAAGRPCLLLHRPYLARDTAPAAQHAVSRWRIAAIPGPGGPDMPAWRVELLSLRGAAPWQAELHWRPTPVGGGLALLGDPGFQARAAAG